MWDRGLRCERIMRYAVGAALGRAGSGHSLRLPIGMLLVAEADIRR